jgi:hypothetical protein
LNVGEKTQQKNKTALKNQMPLAHKTRRKIQTTTKQLLSIISTDRLRRLRKLPQGRYFSAVQTNSITASE